ncbi:g1733 [Coccomyxa viridis]|uniref:G1733 protein n=1 Tax=Coccomyxa viridis TaxID=1274662 RepID=A0ABP1FKA4_9CHLO
MGFSALEGSWLEGQDALVSTAVGALTFWLLGAVVGLLLPRPKWLATSSFLGPSAFYSPAGVLVRRLSLLFQGLYILREVWFHFTLPGTFSAIILAIMGLCTGQGWKFQLPQREGRLRRIRSKKDVRGNGDEGSQWYVGDQDLEFFKERVEVPGEVKGAGPWEHMMYKDFGSFTYEAWRRSLTNGKTEYKSVTVAEDSTAEEFMDFYLDDDTRATWDTMISEHELLENGNKQQRCQVVRWVRTFPFSFLSKREYCIGRRMWRSQDGCLYGITKSIEHPRAPPARGIVRMDVFWSMWRSRTIPCPHGTGRPACETVLLHHEQFKIPENLARFAVRAGMTGFVKKLGPAVKQFVEERRQRVSPFSDDTEAYGMSHPVNPPPASAASVASLSDTASEISSTDSESLPDSPSAMQGCPSRRRGGKQRRPVGPIRRLQQINAAVVAAGVAFALGRATSGRH